MLAEQVRKSSVDCVVVAGLYKSDLDGREGHPSATLNTGTISTWSCPVLRLANPVTRGYEFVLMQVDARALQAFLLEAPAGAVAPR